MKTLLKLVLPLLIFTAGSALAEADGPDYYSVHGVAADDVLNIRSKADPHAEKLGRFHQKQTASKILVAKAG